VTGRSQLTNQHSAILGPGRYAVVARQRNADRHRDAQTMAQAVEEMQRLGYVERRSDPNDGSARLVFLTERGKRVKPIAVATGRQVEAQWIDLIGKRHVDALRRSLQTALRALSSTPSV
jgi:DNA-binding MarR family transcriptional regulator